VDVRDAWEEMVFDLEVESSSDVPPEPRSGVPIGRSSNLLLCPIHLGIDVVLSLLRVVVDGEKSSEEQASNECHWEVQEEESVPSVEDAWKQEEGNNVNGFAANEDRTIDAVQRLKSKVLVSLLNEVYDISDQVADPDERIEDWAVDVLVEMIPMSLQLRVHAHDGELRESVCVL